MPENDPFGYLRPNDLMGMERLALQRERLGMQEEQNFATNQFRQQAARQRAINSMAALGKNVRFPGLQEAIYTDITGGHIPGATRHNELLDQDAFWRSIREQSMDRPQPQGLYRVGDEYGFNGQRMGNLSEMAPAGTSPDDYFDQIQAKHFANQEHMAGAELDSNIGDMSAQYRQMAAQQMMEKRRKEASDYMKGIEGRYGANAGELFQDFNPQTKTGYDMSTGTAYLPGTVKLDSMGERVELPGRQIRIPMAERQTYGQHAAALAGFEDEEAMRMADPRYAEIQQLRRERDEAEQAEQGRNARQKAMAAFHRLRLATNPIYAADFMDDLGNESAQMNEARLRSPGAPVPRPPWLKGSGFMNPMTIPLGF